MAAISSTGCTVPTSLFAVITPTRTVSGCTARSRAAVSTMPSAPTGAYVTEKPRACNDCAAPSTAGCSIAETMICLPFAADASAAPIIAQLSDSLPPEVK